MTKSYFKIVGPGIQYFPVDDRELPALLSWIADNKNEALMLRQGILTPRSAFTVVRDYDRERGWNVHLGDDKMIGSGSSGSLADSLHEVRALLAEGKTS